MNIYEKIAEYKADIEKCERICEVTAIGSIRDAAIRKADDCKEMVEWLEDYKRLKTEHETVETMRADLMKLPYTYNKMFPYERIEYVKRDDVLKIFKKYTEGDKGGADSN
jgi:L-arabinose isomerase